MNVEFMQENNKNWVNIKTLISLIRTHYENDDNKFEDICFEVCRVCHNAHEPELEGYILALMGKAPTFVPQDVEITK